MTPDERDSRSTAQAWSSLRQPQSTPWPEP
jgi:hypothetical protein